MMTYLVSQRTRSIGAVTVGASLLASLRVIYSGSIAHSRNSDTTHSFKKPANLGCIAILPHSPQNTIRNRGFSDVGFEAINPQSTVSAQANRGFSAVEFETVIGGAV